MTTTNGSHHDLAADLLADLTRPAPVDAPATRSIGPAADVPAPSAVQRPGPEGVVRLSPRDWRRPTLNLSRQRAVLRVGPMSAELRLG